MHNTVEYYDIELSKWVLKESMNTARTMFSATNIKDFLYVFGGFMNASYAFAENLFERYSISNDNWEILEIEQKFSFIGGSVINRTKENQILILGGVNPSSLEQGNKRHSLHLYTPETGDLEE